VSRPASAARAVAALAGHELRLTARRGENVLATLVIPVAFLLFFGATNALPDVPRGVETQAERVGRLLPGIIAIAIIASGLVNLGIATAYERSYGVLKRLGGAPLPRWSLLAAKLVAVLVLEVVQVILLLATAMIAFGWRPGLEWSPLLLVGAVLLGTWSFASLGFLLAGTLRAEAVLALANGLFVAILLLGGVLVPVDVMPEGLRTLAGVLPSASLAELLAMALGTAATTASHAIVQPTLVLGAWATAASLLAIRWFRWD
jgi:ABC-2 type transport system permease protein